MAGIVTAVTFFLPLIAVIAFFVVSLILYLSAKKQQKRDPESVTSDRLRVLRILLIVSSVMAGLLVAVAAALILMLYLAIAYM